MTRKISSVRPVRFPAEYGPPGEADALLAWSDVEERIRAAPNHWITTVKKNGLPGFEWVGPTSCG